MAKNPSEPREATPAQSSSVMISAKLRSPRDLQ